MSRVLAAQLRRWTVDTTAMILFCTATGMAVELLLSGLTLSQSLAARLAAVPLNLVTARPYGLYRDWLMRRAGSTAKNALGRASVDVLAFVSFQVPIYATVLSLAGASLAQVFISCATLALLSTVLGRPYGIFLELCRRVAGPNAFEDASLVAEGCEGEAAQIAAKLHSKASTDGGVGRKGLA